MLQLPRVLNTNVLCPDSQVGRDLVLLAWHNAATSTPNVVVIPRLRYRVVDDVPGIAGMLMRWGIRFDAGPCT